MPNLMNGNKYLMKKARFRTNNIALDINDYLYYTVGLPRLMVHFAPSIGEVLTRE
jgi:hypothetical protein